jgi:hypothetical protein
VRVKHKCIKLNKTILKFRGKKVFGERNILAFRFNQFILNKIKEREREREREREIE